MAEEQMPVQTGYAPINGLKLYYEVHGKGGMPLVLVHGGGSTIQTTFGNIIGMLSNDRQVIALELQAHGRTEDIDRPLSFTQDADDVAGLLRFLKIGKADLLGFSNGGNTVMQVGIRHSELVNKLVVVSAFYQREGLLPGFFESMEQATVANVPAPLATVYMELDPSGRRLQRMFERDSTRMRQVKDWPDEALRSIQALTMVINADRDVVLNEHAVKMARLIPNAELMILPGTHGSFLGEICTVEKGSAMPRITATLVKAFLDK